MADSKIILLGGAAVAVWWFYFRTPSSTGTPSPSPTPSPTPTPTPTPGIPEPVQFDNRPASLDSYYTAMLAAATKGEGGTGRFSVDTWGYYLNSVLPAGKSAPDPMPIFSAADAYGPSFDRGTLMSPSQYWGIMSPVLAKQLGMSGLGFYGGGFRQVAR